MFGIRLVFEDSDHAFILSAVKVVLVNFKMLANDTLIILHNSFSDFFYIVLVAVLAFELQIIWKLVMRHCASGLAWSNYHGCIIR